MMKDSKISSLRRPRVAFALYVIIPIFAFFVIIRVFPILGTLFLGFFDWGLISPTKPFIGFENYTALFNDSLFIIALRNTGVLAFLSVIITMAGAFGLALILNRKKTIFADIYKLIYFVPFVISWVPLSVIWKWMYDPSYGILNYVVGLVGIPPQGWLVNPKLSLYSVIILIVWRSVGFNTILFSVGLKNIPSEYLEAGRIDGAESIPLFRYITLPLLKPIILYILIMTSIINFGIFSPVYILTVGSQGAPSSAVRVLVFDIYQNAFVYLDMGYAAAESTIFLILVVFLTLIEFKLIKSKA